MGVTNIVAKCPECGKGVLVYKSHEWTIDIKGDKGIEFECECGQESVLRFSIKRRIKKKEKE